MQDAPRPTVALLTEEEVALLRDYQELKADLASVGYGQPVMRVLLFAATNGEDDLLPGTQIRYASDLPTDKAGRESLTCMLLDHVATCHRAGNYCDTAQEAMEL